MLRVALLLALGSAGASDRLYKAAWPAITEAYFRKVLDESGDAELTYVGRYGVTVLMAVVNNHDWPEQVAALLDRGANVSATSHGDMTALHLAAGHNRTRAARVLLEYGADATIGNQFGTTAAQFARKQGFPALAAEIDRFTPQLFGGDATATRDAVGARNQSPDAEEETAAAAEEEEDEDDSRGGTVPPSSPGWRWRWRKEAKREFFAQAKAQAFAEEFADLSDEEVSRYLQRIGAPKSELRR